MSKFFSLRFLIFFAFAGSLQAQLSGTYNIPINYSSLAAAINDLNTQGISGPVIIQINAGYSELAPVGGYSLTASGTSLHPITFIKVGIGLNPLITAYSGGTGTPASANQDGVWRLIGSDYITIDGIDITDPNVSNPSTMEYGYGFFKLNAGDGCQHNIIQNCVVRLNRVNNATGVGPAADGSRAINVVSSLHTSQTSALSPTSSAGSNSYNKFYNNTLQNCNIGIALIGFAVGSPFAFADIANEIGSSSPVTGNTIQNFGGATGATNAAAAIRTLAQYDLNVMNNVIQNNNGSGVDHTTTLRGVYLNTATSANASVVGNTITLSSAASNALVAAIENASGASAANNTISIADNEISNCSNSANTTGSFYGIYNNAASCAFLEIKNNTFTGITTNASSGSQYMIYNTGAVTSQIEITNNLFSNITNSATSTGNFYGIYSNAISAAWLTMSSNAFSNNSTYASTGSFYGIYNSSAINNSITIQNNSISNSSHSAASSGSYFGLFNNGVGTNDLNMSLNSFASNTLNLQNGSAYLIYNNGANGNDILLNNNTFVNSLTNFNSNGSFFSIYNNTASAAKLQINNTLFSGNNFAATSGSVQVLFNRGAGTNTFSSVSFTGNVISNCTFSASSTSPFLGIYNSGVTATNLAMSQNTLSGMNWLGSTSARYLIYNTGSVSTSADLTSNTISGCTSSFNTTGLFYGILNTGSVGLDLKICQNKVSTTTNFATNGGTYLFYNSGVVSGGVITMTANTIETFSNTATGTGVFNGVYNNGSSQNALFISNTTFSNCYVTSASGAIVYINNNGLAASTISSLNLSNNVFSNCSTSITSSGSSYGIYNSTASSQSLTMSNNTFTNHVLNTVNGSNFLIYNSGALSSTFSSVSMNSNRIDNCSFSATSTSPFYLIWNNGVSANMTSINSNSITNSNWNTTSSLKYLIANMGVSSVSANMDNNLFSNCNFTLSTTGSLYGIYYNNNTSASSGDLSVKSNTFTNINRTASTGETHFINVSGSSNNVFNSIAVENNVITACSTSITGTGALYGVYDNSASTNSLTVNSNSFTGNYFGAFNGATYLIYARGVGATYLADVSFNSNLISGNTSSISSNGPFYGMYISGAVTSTCTNLSMSNNTYTNTDIQSTNGAIYLFYSTCPVTNSISIVSNTLSGISNTLTTTGAFYGIYNSAGSVGGDLTITSNVFSNLNSTSTSGTRNLIYNGGGIGNVISMVNNVITNCNHVVSGNASYTVINNNSGFSGSLVSISNNTLIANTTSLTTGTNYYILNSGALSTTLNTVNLTNNVINSYTLLATSGQFLGVTNTGVTSNNLSIQSNSITGMRRDAVSGNQQLFVNSGRVTNSLSIASNFVSAYSSTLNTSGGFYGINNSLNFANGNFPTNLIISNNRFLASDLSSTNGPIYFINNTAAVSNTIITCNIVSNEIANQNHTVSAGGGFYGINSSGITYSTLSVSNNSLTNTAATTTSSTRYMVYNSGIILSAANYSNNLIANYTSTNNTAGNFFGILNQGNSNGVLSVLSNSFTNVKLNSTTGSSYLIYNTMTMNGVSLSSNIFSAITHSSSASGTFYGFYNQITGATSLAIVSNTLSNVDIKTTTTSNYLIYSNGVVTNTINTVNLSNNTISNYSLQSNSGNLYGIYNNGLTSGNLSVSNNSILNANVTASNTSCYFFHNAGPVQTNLNINGNYISAFSNSLNTNGSHNYLYNRGDVAGSLSISNNTVSNQVLSSNNASAFVIYNTGIVSNSISINSNLVSSFTHSASGSGGLTNIYNFASSSAYLSIGANDFNTISVKSANGSFYHIYNRASIASNINDLNITNNSLTNFDFNTGTGFLYGIYNNGFNFSNLSVSGNSLVNIATTSSTSPKYMLLNNGNGSSAIVMSNNFISNITSTLSTTGVFYDLYNSGSCSGDFYANNNRFLNHYITSTTGFMYTLLNSGSITNSISISNNLISGFTYSSSNSSYVGISNNSSNALGISISTNTLLNIEIANAVSAKYLIYNTCNASNFLNITSNILTAYTNTTNITGNNYGIYNTGSSSGMFNIISNQLNGISVTSSTSPIYFIFNTGSGLSPIHPIRVSANTFSNLNVSTVTGSVAVCFNSGNSIGQLEQDGNQFLNSHISDSTGTIYMNYNSGTINGNMSFTNNSISTNTVSGSSNVNWYGIRNEGNTQSNLNMSTNSISFSSIETGLGSVQLISNSGNIDSTSLMNYNSTANFSLNTTTSGDVYGVVNSGSVIANLSMNSNTFSLMNVGSTSGNVSLLSNLGYVGDAITFTSNALSCGFTNTLTDFSGNFNGISNTGGSVSTSVNVVSNNFSNINFTGVTGTGNLFFIQNTNNSDQLDISGNTWSNLNLNHSGNQHLIFNPSSTQASLTVMNNSIITGYTRSGNAGSLYLYYANGNSPAACTQNVSNNNFSNITANTQGTGSFYGFFSSDGVTSPFPKKLISNNIISNVSYKGLGFLFGYSFDYLGDGTSSSGSSIHTNTISNIDWGGPIYGLSVGTNVSPNFAATVNGNVILSLSTNGQNAENFAAYLSTSGGLVDFTKNKISDISSNGTSATACGLYVGGPGRVSVSNNMIGNIFTPSTSAVNALNGIYVAGTGTVNLVFNTVYLNASGSGTNFGSNAIYALTSSHLNLQNNIFLNFSSVTGSGIVSVYRRSSNSVSNYLSTSNNNVFYAGIPSANHVLFHDGTNSQLTLPAFQLLVSPRESLSASENSPLVSTLGTASNYLHMNVTIPSITDNGAVNAGGITNDFDLDIRQGNVGYLGIGTAPDIGADEYDGNLTPCSSANSGTVIIPTASVICSGESAYMLSSGATAAGGIVYQWRVSGTPGGPYTNVSGGVGANTTAYTTPTLSAGSFYYVLATTCTVGSLNATSNEVTLTVNQTPTVSVSGPSIALCSGQDLILSANGNSANTFNWVGPNNFSTTVQSPTITNVSTNDGGTYNLLVTNLNCTAMPAFVTVTVNPTPPQFSLSPASSSLCAGSSQTIGASIPITNPTLNFGSQTYQNSASGYPAPYSVYYGGQKMQILILAGELASAGFTTGTPIGSLQFSVNSFGSNWGSSLTECKDFQILMKSTSVNQLTVFETGLIPVYGPVNYTPVIGSGNTHSFTSPFIWDGTSNIVIETIFSNTIIGSAGNTVAQNNSPTGFQSTLVYRADNQTSSAIALATTSNVNVGFVRPDFILNGTQVGTYSWSPSFGLSSTNTPSVNANPTVTTLYSVSLSNGLCASTNSMNLNVILTPTVTVATTSSLVCLGNNATLTANGASTYTWSTNSNATSIVVSPFVNTTYTVVGSNAACPNASDTITILSAPALVLTSTITPATLCQGQTATITVNGANSYTWGIGSNSSSISVTPSLTTNYVVNANSGPGCWASKTILAKVNPIPFISITPNSATICPGQTITLEASGVFSFTWASSNSNSPIIEISPSVTTVYSVTGVDLNLCTNSASMTVTVDPCVSISEAGMNASGISVFPNPTDGKFRIQFSVSNLKTITMCNALGSEIMQMQTEKEIENIDISLFDKGVYFLKISSESGTSIHKLILN